MLNLCVVGKNALVNNPLGIMFAMVFTVIVPKANKLTVEDGRILISDLTVCTLIAKLEAIPFGKIFINVLIEGAGKGTLKFLPVGLMVFDPGITVI